MQLVRGNSSSRHSFFSQGGVIKARKSLQIQWYHCSLVVWRSRDDHHLTFNPDSSRKRTVCYRSYLRWVCPLALEMLVHRTLTWASLVAFGDRTPVSDWVDLDPWKSVVFCLMHRHPFGSSYWPVIAQSCAQVCSCRSWKLFRKGSMRKLRDVNSFSAWTEWYFEHLPFKLLIFLISPV